MVWACERCILLLLSLLTLGVNGLRNEEAEYSGNLLQLMKQLIAQDSWIAHCGNEPPVNPCAMICFVCSVHKSFQVR